jgi:hypothetical protein
LFVVLAERVSRRGRKSGGPNGKVRPAKELPAMNTILVTTQIVAYGVGIVSASLNIAGFVRRVRLRRLRGSRVPRLA